MENTKILLRSKRESNKFYLATRGALFLKKTVANLCHLLDADVLNAKHIPYEQLVVGTRRWRTSPGSSQMEAAMATMSEDGDSGIVSIEEYVTTTHDGSYDVTTQTIISLQDLLADEELIEFSTDPEYLNRMTVDGVRYEHFGKALVEALNQKHGLALNAFRIDYFVFLFDKKYQRVPTLTELHLFSQLNSEHCQHNIFKGVHTIDGTKLDKPLFDFIKDTYLAHPWAVVVAYKDNGAIIKHDDGGYLVIKCETHNHPCAISPHPGGGTGAGGDFRDIMGAGRGSNVEVSTALYAVGDVTRKIPYRKWHATPLHILEEASAGVNSYGNEFAAPLINGSTLALLEDVVINNATFAHAKPIVMAWAAGWSPIGVVEKDKSVGNIHIKLGGPDYAIGIGGAAASSLNAWENSQSLDFASVQRANAIMQIKVKNVISTLIEEYPDAIRSIHDYGAGGHGTNMTELYEPDDGFLGGGKVDIANITVADKAMSYSEVLINESQERMGLLINPAYVDQVKEICKREKCPIDVLGEVTGDGRLHVFDSRTGKDIVNVLIDDFIMADKEHYQDETVHHKLKSIDLKRIDGLDMLAILQHPTVGSKGYIVSHVDRSVRGKVAQQQTIWPRQLPLSDFGIFVMKPWDKHGTALSQGFQPYNSLISPAQMATHTLVEAMLNQAGVLTSHQSLSGNWMVSAKTKWGKADLAVAVQQLSHDAIAVWINIPVGKDSLSMKVTDDDGKDINAPASLALSLFSHVPDIARTATADLKNKESTLLYIPALGVETPLDEELKKWLWASIAALLTSQVGNELPDIDITTAKRMLAFTHALLEKEQLLACHDISEGWLRATLVEMYIAWNVDALTIQVPGEDEKISLLSELPGLVVQIKWRHLHMVTELLTNCKLQAYVLGRTWPESISKKHIFTLWQVNYTKEQLLNARNHFNAQREGTNADSEFVLPKFHVHQETTYQTYMQPHIDNTVKRVAILRDEWTNGEYDMHTACELVGLKPEIVHMTDLINGRYALTDAKALILPWWFSYGDWPRSGKAFAEVIKNHPVVAQQFEECVGRGMPFLAVCNGNQVMQELWYLTKSYWVDTIFPMQRNNSWKFESRMVGQKIIDDDSPFLRGMKGEILPIWVAHAEGKYADELFEVIKDIRISTVYVNTEGNPTTTFPYNPNGSKNGASWLLSRDGSILSMMPHPERMILPHQIPYAHANLSKDYITRLKLFANLKKNI